MLPLFAVGAGLMVMNGVMQMNAGNDAADATLRSSAEQAATMRQRGVDTAGDILGEGARAAGDIRARAMASGVEFEGSPYVAAMEAIQKSRDDAEKAKEYANQEAQFIMTSGRTQATSYQAQGRAALFGAFGSAAMAGANYAQSTMSRG